MNFPAVKLYKYINTKILQIINQNYGLSHIE